MNPLVTGKALGSAADLAQGLATDGRSLDGLKRAARTDPQAALKQAATQFESLFMQMVLKSMRDAIPQSGLLDSSAQQMYTGMLDQQLAGRIAGSGTGLAEVIARQLGRFLPSQAAPAPNVQGAVPPSREAARGADAGAAAVGAGSSKRETIGSQSTDRQAADWSAAAANRMTAPVQQRAFVSRMWDHALHAERATGVPARFIVGQAALESGWGRNEIRTAAGLPAHNLFGIKAGANWKGPTVDVTTTEYENGVAKQVVEKFRAYANYTEAFRDWARLIGENPRYAGVRANARDASAFASALQSAGYATDPLYSAKLTRVIGAVSALHGKA